MPTKWVVFDAEGDGLKPTKIYCLSWKDYEGKRGSITDYGKMVSFFQDYEVYIGHNIRRFDIPRFLEGILRIDTEDITFVDTMGLSWYLFPERSVHSLKSFGPDYGFEKVFIEDWFGLTLEEYIERCEVDVDINYALWLDQLDYLIDLYDGDIWPILRYLDFKLYCAFLAEESRWRVDVQYLNESIAKLEEIQKERKYELRKAIPTVPIVKRYERPKRLRNSDGQLSVLGQRWEERLRQAGLPLDHAGFVEEVVGEDEGNPDSPQQVKDWLYSLGWVPQTFKHTRNKKTGELKSVPQVNAEPGKICESVKLLYDKEPRLEALEGLSVVNHRLALLNGFRRDMSDDGYLTAAVQGLTNTLRFKHTEIVNLPKLGKAYWEEVRGVLLASDDDHELCGADMSSLEDRLKQHFLFPHDPEYVNELNRPDYDPHLDLAFLAGAITADDIAKYNAKDHDTILRVRPIRSIYKNGNYACQYGAGVSRLAITCACDTATARKVHETYWKRNWAIRAVSKEQRIRSVRGQQWLYNPISNLYYSLRQEKDIFSTLVQGSAVYCFDLWVRFVVKSRRQLTGQFHDEIILNVKKGHRDEIRDFLERCIRETNEVLQLNRTLSIGIEFGDRYSEIH